MAANWSEIAEELVDMVVERLVFVDDLIRFRCVCKSWRSVSFLPNQKKKAYAPVMMLANTENDINGYDEEARWFLITYKGPNKVKTFDIELPKVQGTRCWGSPYGWVVNVGLDPTISLLNPLSGEQLLLPPQGNLQNLSTCIRYINPGNFLHPVYNRKFSLGWHPSSHSWLVMAIFGDGSEVAFAFTGIGNQPSSSSSWTYIQSSSSIQDVILFQGRIFLMGYNGNLSVCDINAGTPQKAVHIAPQPEELMMDIPLYLVEIGGHLHLVGLHSASVADDDKSEYYELTSHFVVWRFNFTDSKWYELDDFGEYALFLGNNASFAISTTTYPDFASNCIFFTQNFDITLLSPSQLFCDSGVYNYVERTVERFDIAKMGAFSSFARPIFFMPTL